MTRKEELVQYVLAKLAEGPKIAKDKTHAGGKPLNYRRVYYRLEKRLKEFMDGEKEGRLILLPGLRGVGKTTIVLQLYNHLMSKGVSADEILYFSADESIEYLGAGVSEVVKTFVEEIHRKSLVNLDKNLFVFIDEAHFDKKWATASKIVYDKTDKLFLLVTGSSALSMELSVDLARRASRESVFPLNFSEYMVLKHNFFPPGGTAESLRQLMFKPSNLAKDLEKAVALRKSLIKKGISPEKEWEDFLFFGGFPFALRMGQIEGHERLFSMIEKVVEKDVFSLQSFSTETRNVITRILAFLALQRPGGTSDSKLSESLGKSPTLVRSILDILEKTHLVFSVKPHGGAVKKIRKPWKYYFLSPSINAAMRFKLGSYDRHNRDLIGILAETLVASTLFRIMETSNAVIGISYDPEPGGVDFLVHTTAGELIPIEVGVGKKDDHQIISAMKRYGSKRGILISESDLIEIKNGITRIPITLFSFV